MTVRSIKEIKSIDAFDSLDWSGPDLKKFNLIYGWNGSGKTTISRLFNILETGKITIPELSTIEFTVNTDSGTIKQNQILERKLAVRVFNRDFIEENLAFTESHAKKIVILGKANINIQNDINALQESYEAEMADLQRVEDRLREIPNVSDVLTHAGRQVTQQFGNTPLANDTYYGRSYNKSKVEKLLDSGQINPQNLSSLVLPEPSKVLDLIGVIKAEKRNIQITIEDLPDFKELFNSANSLLGSRVPVSDIAKFKDDKELRNWVEVGLKIHKERGYKECEFCTGQLPDERLVILEGFFTEELQKIKGQIQQTIKELSSKGSGIPFELESTLLFPESATKFVQAKEILQANLALINEAIEKLIDTLKEKEAYLHDHNKAHEEVPFPQTAVEKANVEITNIRQIIDDHNIRVEQLSEEVQKAANQVELHTIASALEQADYFNNHETKAGLETKVQASRAKLAKISSEIGLKKASLENAAEAIERINSILTEFFGSGHLYLEMTETKDGESEYVLIRRGKPARYLSEGEESVLALVYFLVKLDEDGCEKDKCLIVIDDPVDSQDSNFLFRTAALIKRQLSNCGQLLILTHSFEFFNLMRDWLLSKPVNGDYGLHLISRDSGRQVVDVKDLPELLKNFKSEYQYLFYRLYRYANGSEGLDEPLIANIARKVLEYFAGFKWSCRSSEDFTNIVLTRFVNDQNTFKKGVGDFVVKFVGEYSHGQDFSRPISASMFEAQAIADNVMKFIKLADPEHFKDLERLCNRNNEGGISQ